MKKYAMIWGILLAAPFFFCVHSAHALELSPVFFDLTAKPGQTLTQFITVRNETTSVMTLTHQVGIIQTSSADGTTSKLLPKPTDMMTIADWITIKTPRVTLKPGESQKIPYILSIPEDAEPGGHYAWISWNEAPTSVKGAHVAISSGVATQILLKVEGEVSEGLMLQQFQTNKGMTSFEKLPISFVAHIFNEGNTHQRPTGAITIKNMFGTTVATLPFNKSTEGGNILPKTGRSYETLWNNGFALGKYTVSLDATYSDGKHLTGQMHVWVLPKALIAVWLLILVVIVMLIVQAVMHTHKRRRTKSHKKTV